MEVPTQPVPPETFPDATVRPFHELRDSGLLWLINATVFHPRGYALAIALDEDGRANGWELFGDGTEPWRYNCDDETSQRLDELFDSVNGMLR